MPGRSGAVKMGRPAKGCQAGTPSFFQPLKPVVLLKPRVCLLETGLGVDTHKVRRAFFFFLVFISPEKSAGVRKGTKIG